MIRSLKDLESFRIQAKDGALGRCRDFLFDDNQWRIRYIVVDTGNWLTGRKVILSPTEVKQPDWEQGRLPVNLTSDRVRNSPELETHAPVSRKTESDLALYYSWPSYWTGIGMDNTGALPSGVMAPIPNEDARRVTKDPEPGSAEAQGEAAGPNLRSVNEVIGYGIEASDGSIGHIADFLFDDDDWTLRYLVIDTRNWLPGKRVLLAPRWASAIRWNEQAVHTQLERDQIKSAPEFQNAAQVDRNYEESLHEHYEREPYWEI